MKAWAESQIKNGILTIVVDLEECTGMDSTFMGTMAGIAMKLAKKDGGSLQVASPSDKNRRSLEDLGLSMLLKIDPKDAPWQENLETIRTSLKEHSTLTQVDKTQHVFDAHKLLCEAHEGNDDKFATVLDVLEAELANRQKH